MKKKNKNVLTKSDRIQAQVLILIVFTSLLVIIYNVFLKNI